MLSTERSQIKKKPQKTHNKKYYEYKIGKGILFYRKQTIYNYITI